MPTDLTEFPKLRKVVERSDLIVRRAFDLMLFANSATTDDLTIAGNKQTITDDVMRAAVVLSHAAIDDMIRSIGRIKYLQQRGPLLASLPIAGGDKTTVNLAGLVSHAGKTVTELVEESISCYFDRRSFNSCTEVMGFLESIGVRPSVPALVLQSLDELMKRRHRIVHQGDVESADGLYVPALADADMERFMLWARAARAFMGCLLLELAPSNKRGEFAPAADSLVADLQRFAAELNNRI